MQEKQQLNCLSVVLFKGDDYESKKEAEAIARRFYCDCDYINADAIIIAGEEHALICAYNAITNDNATLDEVMEAVKNRMCKFTAFRR